MLLYIKTFITHTTAHNIDNTWMHFMSLRRILNPVCNCIVFYEGSLSRFELPPQTREQCMVLYLGKLFAGLSFQTNGFICKLFLCLQNPHLLLINDILISIYRNKIMNLNKRSRRRRNINIAQHETTKMPVRLPKRLLSQAIFNNAIHRIFFSAFSPTILLWKVLLDLHFSNNFTQKTVKFIKFMDISVNFPWTGGNHTKCSKGDCGTDKYATVWALHRSVCPYRTRFPSAGSQKYRSIFDRMFSRFVINIYLN